MYHKIMAQNLYKLRLQEEKCFNTPIFYATNIHFITPQ